MELINILIRTGLPTRKDLFHRCLQSIYAQNYPRIRIILSIDRDCDYVPDDLECIRVVPGNELFFYDKYLNDLKALVTDGYIIFFDDDDVLLPNVLNQIVFDAPAIIHKLNHIGRILPPDNRLIFGQIGFPCIMLHHSLKDIADVGGDNHNDYHYIKAIGSKVPLVFRDLVLVQSFEKGNGL